MNKTPPDLAPSTTNHQLPIFFLSDHSKKDVLVYIWKSIYLVDAEGNLLV